MRVLCSLVLWLVIGALGQTADFNAISKPAANEIIPANSIYQVQWQVSSKYAGGTVAISLLRGPTQALLASGGVIASEYIHSYLCHQYFRYSS
jgi:hypothetical protein